MPLQTNWPQIPNTTWRTLNTGLKLLVYNSSDIVSDVIRSSGGWESWEIAHILDALRMDISRDSPAYTPPVFVDVGANVGAFTMSVAHAGFRVYAFEGFLTNSLMIRSSLCANPPTLRHTTLFYTGLGAAPNK